MILTPEASVTYASKEFCFAVKPSAKEEKRRLSIGFTGNNEWFLMTEKDSDR